MRDITKVDPILLDIPMPIQTPRLTLRPKQAGDGAETSAAVLETWEQLNKWMPWATDQGEHTVEKQELHARQCAAQFILRKDLMLMGVENETDTPVIWTGLHRPDWNTRTFSIGYWVRKKAQGQGYATESTFALVWYAFEALKAQRVEISHAIDNQASRRVIEKIGFKIEGTKRNAMRLPDGSFVNEVYYALSSKDNLPELKVSWGS